MKHKFYMTAELESMKETKDLRKEVASVIDLPSTDERQPDLSYFTSRFVSTGTNLNNAHFLASELVKASRTVSGKAVDIEHEEEKIIGHIYKHEFTDGEGKHLAKDLLKSQEVSKLNTNDLHIEIASVVYKTRFPEVAEEIKKGEWKVSMEAYFTSFDVLVGNTILTSDEAKLMGFDVSNEDLYGKSAKIVKAGEVVDEGNIARVLRGICFSGVGIVKSPANPPSIVFEATASEDTNIVLELDLDKLNVVGNNVTSSTIEKDKEEADIVYDNTEGICVSYHKELNDSVVKDQDSKVIAKNWCSKYEESCSVNGEATSPECLRFTKGDMIFVSATESYEISSIEAIVVDKLDKLQKDSKIIKLINDIEILL